LGILQRTEDNRGRTAGSPDLQKSKSIRKENGIDWSTTESPAPERRVLATRARTQTEKDLERESETLPLHGYRHGADAATARIGRVFKKEGEDE
jgi:hypothetical protein